MLTVLGLVSFRVFPTHMGGQKGVALFYKYLKQHAKVLLAVSDDNQPDKEVVTENILHPNKKIYLNFFRLKKLKEISERYAADIIVAEHSYTGWIAWRLHKATGKPFVVHSHNIESRRFFQMHKWWWKIYQRYEGWVHRKAHHNFFISEEDREFAIQRFHLPPSKCSVTTYGVEDVPTDKNREAIRKELSIDLNKTILLFNGTMDYAPNYDAVLTLINEIEPRLRKKLDQFQIIITGNRARKDLIEKILSAKNILYTGYVDDANLYYRAADIFINPIANDTGVKTKLIEAIANNCTAVSTEAGAAGIRKDLCGDKLIVVKDMDWDSFVEKIAEQIHKPYRPSPSAFFKHYSWKEITKTFAEKLNELES